MKLSRSRTLSWLKKVAAVLAALLIFALPVLSVSAATEDVPHQTFRIQYQQLISNQVVTVDLPGLPSSLQVLNPGIVNVTIDNFIIFYVDSGAGQPFYQAYLFSEGVDPSDVELGLGFNVNADDMLYTYKSKLVSLVGQTKADMYQLIIEHTTSRFTNEFSTLLYAAFLDLYYLIVGANPDVESLVSESALSHSSYYYQKLLLDYYDSNADFMYDMYTENGWRPKTNFSVNYSSPMTHWVFMESYRYVPGVSGTWQFMSSVKLEDSRPYGYAASVVGQPVCSSFNKGNILSSGIVPSLDGLSEVAVINDIREHIRSEVSVTDTSESVPSWSPNQSGGSGSGSISGGFTSGSWYNTGGTGNPFVAVLLAPWIGLQWTWNNVASRINLFGVSIADLLLSFMGLLVVWFLLKFVYQIIKG